MTSTTSVTRPTQRVRRRRSDGERSRQAILDQAARLATVEGIDGLSISRLADAVGMSKSGLFAHFGSKEELQLATVEAASELFHERVVEPASSAPNGLERVRRLAENFFDYLQGAYPGGCFFASVAAELDTRPGPVRDAAMRVLEGYFLAFGAAVAEAQAEGAIDAAEDPRQLAFELGAHLLMANMQFVATGDSVPIEQARRARERLLAAVAPA